MPSSPRIPKETILKHALEMLIRDGYSALNIKAVAKEIGCSTQPISWHFGNMEGFRRALTEYALNYANQKMLSSAEGMSAFSNVGLGYVNLAFDEPNLFRYLYMSGDSGYHAGGFDMFTSVGENAVMVEQIAEQLGIPVESAAAFFRNTMIYTHGLACFIVSGLVKATKDEINEMVNSAANGFLLQAGADFSKMENIK